jgi:hypothetical protein
MLLRLRSKIGLSHIALTLFMSIVIINEFGLFRIANLYWWSFFGLTFLVGWIYLSIWIPTNGLAVSTFYKSEKIFLLCFIGLATVSLILNPTNLLHGFYAIGMKMLPIGFLTFCLNWVIRIRDSQVSQKLVFQLVIAIFYLNLIVSCFQYFVLGLAVDLLGSIPSNAHTFGFLNIFFGLLLWNYEKYRNVHRVAYLFSFFIMIVADYKLGLIIFLLALLVSKFILSSLYNGKVVRNLLASLCLLIIIAVGFYLSIPFLPPHYRAILLILDIEQILNLDTVIPPSLELFKGYYQLFTRVYENTYQTLFGVGPGNYGSNVAISLNKPLATKYISYYRAQLDQMNVVSGTLLVRNNATVTLLAEYGLLGASVYLLAFIRIILFPLRVELKEFNNLPKSSIYPLMVLFFFLLMEIPLVSVIDSGLYLSVFVLFYYHFKLTRYK